MKRILLFLIAIFFTTNVFATGIGADDTTANCDNNTLGQTSGTANIEVDWQPNTIDIRWYDGETQLNVQTSAQSCVYDNDLYLPTTQPTKTGYTFKGWKVRFSTCGINELDVNIRGNNRGAFGIDGKRQHNIDIYNLTQIGTWGTSFSYGDLHGKALCSSAVGTTHQIGVPDINNVGFNCWCSLTGYKPAGGETCPTSSGWAFAAIYDSTDLCLSDCADTCGYWLWNYYDFRVALYGSVYQ